MRARIDVYFPDEEFDFIFKFAKANGNISMAAAVRLLVSKSHRAYSVSGNLPQPIVSEIQSGS